MEDLIKALQIFLKYENPHYPTNCTHDKLYVNINPEFISKEDKEELKRLSFNEDEYGFTSYRFGSC